MDDNCLNFVKHGEVRKPASPCSLNLLKLNLLLQYLGSFLFNSFLGSLQSFVNADLTSYHF